MLFISEKAASSDGIRQSFAKLRCELKLNRSRNDERAQVAQKPALLTVIESESAALFG